MKGKTYQEQYKASMILLFASPWCALAMVFIFPPLGVIVLIGMLIASVATFMKGVQLQRQSKKSQ